MLWNSEKDFKNCYLKYVFHILQVYTQIYKRHAVLRRKKWNSFDGP